LSYRPSRETFCNPDRLQSQDCSHVSVRRAHAAHRAAATGLEFEKCEQIAQRILWPIQPEDRQTCGSRCLPVTFWIIPDMKDLARFQIH